MRNRSISERKEAQETVRATEQHVRLLVEATRAIPWEASAETFQFTYVGPQVVKLFGYPLERWYEDHFWISHIHPADRDDAVEFCLKSSQSFENYEFEYRMIASDEKTVWIHDIVNVVSHDGVPKTHRGFLIDISERKREQEVLQNSKEQLRLITDSLPVCISYVDAEQRYQFNNKTYESWFGLSRSELKGRHLKEVLGASAYETIQGPAEEALSGRAVTFETVLPYIGAGERHVLANFVPDVADRGKVKGFFVLVTDITERNRIEKALRQSEAALRQSQKSLRGLAGRLLSAQEDERRRIAQELHDDSISGWPRSSLGSGRSSSSSPSPTDPSARLWLNCGARRKTSPIRSASSPTGYILRSSIT